MDTNASSMDMSQFQGAFFEEAAEHLAQMETLLVGIDVAAPPDDDLDAIFRSAHSLKGGSAMFGFSDMTTLTHELESLLDQVRRRERPLTSAMVDVLLESSDLLRTQLAQYSGSPGATHIDIAPMCARLRACLRGAPAAQAPSPGAAPAVVEKAVPVVRTIEITFPCAPQTEALIPDLLEQLGELGALDEVTPSPTPGKRARRGKRAASAIPTRTFRLVTDAGEDVVVALFEFVMDSSTVKFTTLPSTGVAAPIGASSEDAAAAPRPASSDDDEGFGIFEPLPGQALAAAQGEHVDPLPVAATVSAEPKPSRRDQERAAATSESSIRVSVEKVDQLINQVGELVITQAMLAQSATRLDPIDNADLLARMADLERNTRDLQDSVMSIRMLPISFVFNRFPRLARDLAAKLGKQVQLDMHGEATELDKGLIEKIADPLTHLVRNAIDHGVERPEMRLAAGKPAAGTVTLRAAHQGGNIIIAVSDDGAGLDRERILAKARERGLPVGDAMPDQDVWALIFEAGFSTAEIVTDISGRGVGLDVVKRNIASLGGSVDIDSARGFGTRMTVRLPLTLAIMDGMSVSVGAETYILPLAGIVESLHVSEGQVRSIAGRGLVIDVRSEYVPVVSLHELFLGGQAPGARASGTVVIVEADGGRTAMLVDELLGQHQVVVKSLDTNYRKVPGISGATIMGDGRVALILDIATLTRSRRNARSQTLQ